MTEDEMVAWHHPLDAHEFEQALGDTEGQGSLACCRPCRCREADTAQQLNNKEDEKSYECFVFQDRLY